MIGTGRVVCSVCQKGIMIRGGGSSTFQFKGTAYKRASSSTCDIFTMVTSGNLLVLPNLCPRPFLNEPSSDISRRTFLSVRFCSGFSPKARAMSRLLMSCGPSWINSKISLRVGKGEGVFGKRLRGPAYYFEAFSLVVALRGLAFDLLCLASSRITACSRVIVSLSISFGNVAISLPCLT